MASKSGTLYLGVTRDLIDRVWEHKNNVVANSFTAKYVCYKLVFFENCLDMSEAISREKQVKKWGRGKKEKLIRSVNPKWDDLARDWY